MTNKLSLKQGQKLPISDKLDYLFELREMLEKGYTTTSAIAEHFGITPPVASAWRKQALQLIQKDDNGYSREGIRNIQIGRIQYMIERLQRDLDAATDVDTKTKLHDRIVKYYDSLARITGLNSEVTLHQHQQVKPLQVVMPHTTPVEGELVPPTPDKQ